MDDLSDYRLTLRSGGSIYGHNKGSLRVRKGKDEFLLKDIENIDVEKDSGWIIRIPGFLGLAVLSAYWIPKFLAGTDNGGIWIFGPFLLVLLITLFSSWWSVVIRYRSTSYRYVRGKGYKEAVSIKEELLKYVLTARSEHRG